MATLQPQGETLSAFFAEEARVTEALVRLGQLGVPRDLIEVVLGPEGKARYYQGRTEGRGVRMMAYAGLGALVGFLISSVLSFGIILWPGFAAPGAAALVQLLGPNVGTVTGSAVGAVVGYLARKKPHGAHLRALTKPGILVVVHHRPPVTVAQIESVLADAGGEDLVRT